jgi:hypothetical protein
MIVSTVGKPTVNHADSSRVVFAGLLFLGKLASSVVGCRSRSGDMIHSSKSEILAHNHTLHTGHDRVTDPLVSVTSFFDPRDLVLVKYEMLRRVRIDHWSVTRAARSVAFSRTAWYNAQDRWERTGLLGLAPNCEGIACDSEVVADCPFALRKHQTSLSRSGMLDTKSCVSSG